MPNDENEETLGAGNTESEGENGQHAYENDHITGEEKRKPSGQFAQAQAEPMSEGCRALIALLKSKVPEDQQLVFCAQHESINDAKGWIPINEAKLREKHKNLKASSYYFSTSSAVKTDEGYRNKRTNFGAFLVLVLDDIGTKAISLDEAKAKLQPTYIVESSKGNYQLGYVLTEPCTNYDRAAALVNGAYNGETSDKGGNLAMKFVRLPSGCRNKLVDGVYDDFPVRLVELSGDTYTLEQLEAAFPPKPVRSRSASASGGDVTAFDGLDSVGRVLFEHETVRAQVKPLRNSDGSIGVSCPWEQEHSTGADNAKYWPLGVGQGDQRMIRGFKCHHGHCAERKGRDFVDWVREAIGDAGGYVIPYSEELEALLATAVHIDARPVEVGSLMAAAEQEVWSMDSFKQRYSHDVQIGLTRFQNGNTRPKLGVLIFTQN